MSVRMLVTSAISASTYMPAATGLLLVPRALSSMTIKTSWMP